MIVIYFITLSDVCSSLQCQKSEGVNINMENEAFDKNGDENSALGHFMYTLPLL